MSFKSADDIWFTIYQMVWADVPRAANRERINALAVGAPPFTEREAMDNKIFTNANFLDMRRAIATAQLQDRQAYLKPPRYFDWALDTGPKAKRMEWGMTISNEINRRLKRSHKLTEVLKSKISSARLHGPGPSVWTKREEWCPHTRGVEDILVPSLTLRDRSNLDYFAVFTTFTLAELRKMTSGKYVDPGWNMPLVDALCKKMETELGSVATNAQTNNWQFPEKFGQDLVENSAYIGIDAAPRIRCYDFYFKKEIRGKEQWVRRILLDRVNEPYAGISGGDKPVQNEFLFNPGNRPYADDLNAILHVLFADMNPVAPFRWHNVRSTGMMLYTVGHLVNRMKCKMMDSFVESMNMYFRVDGSGDKERVQNIDLYNYGVIPDGVTVIPQQERLNLNWQNILQVIGGMTRSLTDMSSVVAENSENTNGQPPTATQIVADANNRNAMISDSISDGMDDMEIFWEQLARRFATLDHPDCNAFRRKCEEQGVDKAIWKNPDAWIIKAQRSIGGGNKAIEMTMIGELRGLAPQLGPEVQRYISKLAFAIYSDNPGLADSMMPDAEVSASWSIEVARLAWGTLMQKISVPLTTSVDHKQYTATLMATLAEVVQAAVMAMNAGQMTDMKTLDGYAFISTTIEQELQFIAGDESSVQWSKQAKDHMAQINNELKALIQRTQQAMKAQQPQQDPKAAIEAAKAQQQMQQKAQSHQLSLQNQAVEFQMTQQHRQQQHALDTAQQLQDMQQQHTEHKVDVAMDAAKTAADIQIKRGSAKQAAAATAKE
jgi:hypothetical protein